MIRSLFCYEYFFKQTFWLQTEQDADYSIMETYCLHTGTQITFLIPVSADAYGFCALQEVIIHINKHTVIVCLFFRVLLMSGKCLK